ncbi:hypothetical protein [Rubinisphaera italica]|uniref:Uncharacterized protein n=1 Tax=Rubinisphaera italica TaxID=2527969 RepID=A0A5C5XHA1_9PLAN|nr:hypothetical protein [Rubinisphaera italica]TWT62079.1 hypothetical protein Pan54_28180 [Rubinisphaera italica]
MSTPSKTTSFPTNIILTAGLSILYVIIVTWVSTTVATYLLPQKEQHSQNVTVLGDDTVLIYHNTWHRNISDVYYTTLDGEKYILKQNEVVSNGISLIGETQKYYQSLTPFTPSISIASLMGKEQKPNYWYFIYDSKLHSTGYFVAYHPVTKQIIHYLGQNGFQNSIPTPEEQFPIYGTATNQLLTFLLMDESTYNWNSYPGIPQSTGYQKYQRQDLFRDSGLLLTRKGAVKQINFITGEVTNFLDRSDILSMKLWRLPKNHSPENWATSDREAELVVSFRTPESVLTYGLLEDKSFQVKIPEELHKQNFSLHYLKGKQLLYEVMERDLQTGKYATDLYWADYEGNITQTRDDVIVNYYPNDLDIQKWIIAGVQPAPLTFLFCMLTVPVEQIKLQYDLSTTEAVMKLFQMSLPVVILLLVISAGLLFHYRSYAKHKNVKPRRWEYGFILLMGPFAYLILRWSLKSHPVSTPASQRNNSIEILRPLLKPVSETAI